jgi:hypothetical protein
MNRLHRTIKHKFSRNDLNVWLSAMHFSDVDFSIFDQEEQKEIHKEIEKEQQARGWTFTYPMSIGYSSLLSPTDTFLHTLWQAETPSIEEYDKMQRMEKNQVLVYYDSLAKGFEWNTWRWMQTK